MHSNHSTSVTAWEGHDQLATCTWQDHLEITMAVPVHVLDANSTFVPVPSQLVCAISTLIIASSCTLVCCARALGCALPAASVLGEGQWKVRVKERWLTHSCRSARN
jgi:hypothetical protein